LIDKQLDASLGGPRVDTGSLNVVQQGRASRRDRCPSQAIIGVKAAREVADLRRRGWLTSGTATVELTELGTKEFARLLELVSADRTTLMIGIAPEEYASAVSVLERMARNLGWGAT
jgi:hypothetical protein